MRRPAGSKTVEELINRLPGYKAPTAPAAAGAEPEPVSPGDAVSVREPRLPDFI